MRAFGRQYTRGGVSSRIWTCFEIMRRHVRNTASAKAQLTVPDATQAVGEAGTTCARRYRRQCPKT